jgi:hypothetical protein
MLGAAAMPRVCAIVFLVTLSSCARAHERGDDWVPEAGFAYDLGLVASDASTPPAIDAFTPPAMDAGPITSCFEFWNSLPSCPAIPMAAIGTPCTHEGETCGVHCCEPGPPIGCIGGRWMALEHMENCAGVRCHGPHPCGGGQCAYGRVCVTPAGDLGSAAPQVCVLPPAPIDSCAAAPPGSLGQSSSCMACECGDATSNGVMITLDCLCC